MEGDGSPFFDGAGWKEMGADVMNPRQCSIKKYPCACWTLVDNIKLVCSKMIKAASGLRNWS